MFLTSPAGLHYLKCCVVFLSFSFSKGEYNLTDQQSPAHGDLPFLNYDVSVGLLQETTAFSGDCFQKANAPVQVTAYWIDHDVPNHKGSDTFCWNVGAISERSSPRFTKETEDDFEATIDYGNMPCCPSDSQAGRSHNIPLAVRIIPASRDHCGLEKPDYFELLNSSNLIAMMLNCSFSPQKSATVYFETNRYCPERLFVALNANKTSFECSKYLGGYSCKIVPSPLKNVSNYQPRCNPNQFQIMVLYKSNNSVLPNGSLKTNCIFFVDSSNIEISVKYGLVASSKTSGWTTIKGQLSGSSSGLKLPILYIGLISGGGAVAVLISVLVVVYVKRRRSEGYTACETQSNASIDEVPVVGETRSNASIDEVPVVGETRSNASIDDVVAETQRNASIDGVVSKVDETQRNASIDEVISEVDEVNSEKVWDVVCVSMPCHSCLMDEVLYEIDERIRIVDLESPGRSVFDCLTDAVEKCPLVLIVAGQNENKEDVARFHSDAQIAFGKKRTSPEVQVVPVLLSGPQEVIPPFLRHLNMLDLRPGDSYEKEKTRLKNTVRKVFAAA